MGTSVSVVGGGLTIAGGIMTTLTAGFAAPVLIAGTFSRIIFRYLFFFIKNYDQGIATSSLGAATNIGTSLIEKILNSKQVKEMNAAFQRDKEITLKLEHQLDVIQSYKTSANIVSLLDHVTKFLGKFLVLSSVIFWKVIQCQRSRTHKSFLFQLSPCTKNRQQN